ncbi:MarR family winged helix-turn-helix transcriptional regulator [Luteimonas panaciterrae]|uniref:MarR family winged helix-turn-helix transcriptional regulator n=1 Tax=Luteimonas panaciterrae TaxID=363885 RepID=UPI001CFA0715|nr:MarR family winged helix-turn-helix transcriptional regulator [Luteimonas panaciterrae]
MTASPPSHCTCFLLRRTARQVSQFYDRELAPLGLSLNQYSILKRASREPKVLGEFAEELGMDRTTLTRNLKPLYEAGWLRERRAEDDARRRVIEITPAGRKRIDAALPHWRRTQKRVEALFGQDGIERLHHDLNALHERLSTAAEHAS